MNEKKFLCYQKPDEKMEKGPVVVEVKGAGAVWSALGITASGD